LEALERQLIPPDITTDMYEWNFNEIEENPDYFDFVKDFMSSVDPTTTVETHDDEEADPEYNVMEDEEDDHDREEHRVDRAVKVTKKELNELWAEYLLDGCNFSSGDELEDTSFGQPQETELDKNITVIPSETHNATGPGPSVSSKPVVIVSPNLSNSIAEEPPPPPEANIPFVGYNTELNSSKSCEMDKNNSPTSGESLSKDEGTSIKLTDTETGQIINKVEVQTCTFYPSMEVPLFSQAAYETLQHQLQQHIQLLTQSYILSAQIEEPAFVKAAHTTKSLLVSFLHNMSVPLFLFHMLGTNDHKPHYRHPGTNQCARRILYS